LRVSGDGHVLTFPGLEIHSPLTLKADSFKDFYKLSLNIGRNAKIEKFEINPNSIDIDARVAITPEMMLQDYTQTGDSYGEEVFFDVGKWLTKLGNFTK